MPANVSSPDTRMLIVKKLLEDIGANRLSKAEADEIMTRMESRGGADVSAESQYVHKSRMVGARAA